jgi:hypothetical protein
MISKSTKAQDIEEIAAQAHSGTDISEHFTGQFQAKQKISIDLPLALLRSIDAECTQQHLDRQTWIKLACAEKIVKIQGSSQVS